MTAATDNAAIARAAAAIAAADALLVGAGAGMGVDSGLPDFRGPEGFWRAYPPFRELGLSFSDLANPHWFERDPHLAWGFYGHRLALYRRTRPHAGFAILRQLIDRAPAGGFVFTSNVDGQFSAAKFERDAIVECHGSIHHLQCSRPCNGDIWPASAHNPDVDEQRFTARGELPRCPHCDAIARPNILMFGDGAWLSSRSDQQYGNLESWLRQLPRDARIVKIEIGAGTDVPSVRWQLQQVPGTLVRINPRAPQAGRGDIGIAGGALATLRALVEQF